MIKHYFKIAWRSLLRQKALSAINVFGLSIGIACFVLFLLFAMNEFNYDRFHSRASSLYRVVTRDGASAAAPGDPYMPMPLGPAMKQELPDVEHFVRIRESWGDSYLRAGGELFQAGISFADPQFFSLFDFSFRDGNAATALNDLHAVVLTEKTARRIFGKANPIGQHIEIKLEDEFLPFTVQGVVNDIPSNSSIQFEVLGNYLFLPQTSSGARSVDNWRRSSYLTFVQLKPGSRLPEKKEQLRAFQWKYFPKSKEAFAKSGENDPHFWRYDLQPLRKIHTDTTVNGGSVAPVKSANIWILLGIAAAVLLIACINFTTLAIGRSAWRSREVVIRKVVGSRKLSLVFQFLAEATLLSGISAIIGLVLAYLLLPYFNQLAARQLSLSFTQFPELAWGLLLLVLLVGLLAGSYPALILSGFKPIEVLKQKVKLGGSNYFTRSLVTLQFVLSIGLVASTLTMLHQVRFMKDKYPGFQKENMVMVDAGDLDAESIYPLFRNELKQSPQIIGTASAELGLGADMGWSRSGWQYQGEDKSAFEYYVDPDFLPLMKIPVLAGRNFNTRFAEDSLTSVIINEAMMKDFGWTLDNAVGQRLTGYMESKTPIVIGVCRDFHYRPFSEEVKPQLFHEFADYSPHKFFVRIRAGNPAEAIAAMQKAWKKLVPDFPLQYSFLDENIDKFYREDSRWSQIVGWAGGIAIFLASLGLFGLAALAAINRTREIGIRKVFGASISSIIILLTADFMKLVIWALIIAAPLGWYFMHRWLEHFAYRTQLQWWIFGLAGLSAILIAGLTISLQALRAGRANPVGSLRSE